MTKPTLLLGAIAMLASTSLNVMAADEDEDRWQFISTPFLWGSGLEGDITRGSHTVHIDLGFDDLLDATDFGFQTYIELRKKKFGFFASPSYMKLSGDAESPVGSASFEQHFWLVEAGGFYNLVRTRWEKPFTLDAYAGARYWNIDTEVKIRGGGPFGANLTFGGTVDLIDPMIGMRMRQYFTKKLSLSVRGDVGGFGLSEGNTSDFSWHVTALLGYDFNKKFSIYGGYRVLDVKSEQGYDSARRDLDISFKGALLGLQISW